MLLGPTGGWPCHQPRTPLPSAHACVGEVDCGAYAPQSPSLRRVHRVRHIAVAQRCCCRASLDDLKSCYDSGLKSGELPSCVGVLAAHTPQLAPAQRCCLPASPVPMLLAWCQGRLCAAPEPAECPPSACLSAHACWCRNLQATLLLCASTPRRRRALFTSLSTAPPPATPLQPCATCTTTSSRTSHLPPARRLLTCSPSSHRVSGRQGTGGSKHWTCIFPQHGLSGPTAPCLGLRPACGCVVCWQGLCCRHTVADADVCFASPGAVAALLTVLSLHLIRHDAQ